MVNFCVRLFIPLFPDRFMSSILWIRFDELYFRMNSPGRLDAEIAYEETSEWNDARLIKTSAYQKNCCTFFFNYEGGEKAIFMVYIWNRILLIWETLHAQMIFIVEDDLLMRKYMCKI